MTMGTYNPGDVVTFAGRTWVAGATVTDADLPEVRAWLYALNQQADTSETTA